MAKKRNKSVNPWKAFAVVGVVGIELSILLLVGVWIGKKLDAIYQTSPIFLIIGMLLGLATGIWSVVRLIKPFLGD